MHLLVAWLFCWICWASLAGVADGFAIRSAGSRRVAGLPSEKEMSVVSASRSSAALLWETLADRARARRRARMSAQQAMDSGASEVALKMEVVEERKTAETVRMKIVCVTMESQYQTSLLNACKAVNAGSEGLVVESKCYLLDELKDPSRLQLLQQDVVTADVFIGSLIFLPDIAEKVLQVLTPEKDRLKAIVMLPSMPSLMRLNKFGDFSLERASGRDIPSTWRDVFSGRSASGSTSSADMLNLLRSIPRDLQYSSLSSTSPSIAHLLLSFQYWLAGSPANLRSLLLLLGRDALRAASIPASAITDPVLMPLEGIWHPASDKVFSGPLQEYLDWYAARGGPYAQTDTPRVGILLQRSHLATDDHAHYEAVVSALERQGASVVCIYTSGLDFSQSIRAFFYQDGRPLVDCVINLTGFALVGGPASHNPSQAERLLRDLDCPYLCAIPLVFQTREQWEDSELGLHPVQVALQVAIPEMEGAIEPIVYAAKEAGTGKSLPIADRVDLLTARAMRWMALRRKRNADKKLAVTLFCLPPDKGNLGTAAHLDVFASLLALLQALQRQGYAVGDVPVDVQDLRRTLSPDTVLSHGGQRFAVAHEVSVQDYRRMCPFVSSIEKVWGPAPGESDTHRHHLLVYGKHFGNIFVGVQPSFGYEGDPVRMMYSSSMAPTHAFAAYYAYLTNVLRVDAVVHFGTHGALEFMPGKHTGLTQTCYPDRLVGTLPHLYLYAVNNPSEAAIAKRRSYATIVSYLTPPREYAGLYRPWRDLGDWVRCYPACREDSLRARQWMEHAVHLARVCRLEADQLAGLAEAEAEVGRGKWTAAQRDDWVGRIYQLVLEVESRASPCSLHTLGQPLRPDQLLATLVAVLSREDVDHDRPSLPGLLAQAQRRDWAALSSAIQLGTLEDVRAWDEIQNQTHRVVHSVLTALALPPQPSPALAPQLYTTAGTQLHQHTCALLGCASLDPQPFQSLGRVLVDTAVQLLTNSELDGMLSALQGRYIPPSPGGEVARNVHVLPTGRNIHSLDPQRLPTPSAQQVAEQLTSQLLSRMHRELGRYPRTVAVTLWGTDNIKTGGESLAQVLCLLGVRRIVDPLGYTQRLDLIPLQDLGRPRIDVLVSCSGVFRDLFASSMAMLDRAVRLVAQADERPEDNYLRAHVLSQAHTLQIPLGHAASRVYSNAAGAYSANIGVAIENNAWETEHQLHTQFVQRKSFAFASDTGQLVARPEVFRASLGTVEATLQTVDSVEMSLTDVSHYLDADPTKLVAGLRPDGRKPQSYVVDGGGEGRAKIRSLGEMLRLDARTKLLSPAFRGGMLATGQQGVRELAKRLKLTLGWAATSGEVDNFIFEDAHAALVQDDSTRRQMEEENPHAFGDMVSTFLEASGRGYWAASEEAVEGLYDLHRKMEDYVEGV